LLRLITLLCVSSMTVMAGATISPALPKIEQFFSGQANAEFWVKLLLTLPALFTAIGAPFAGIVIDRFGRKPLLFVAVILYGVAGGSGLVLSDLNALLLGRAALGLAVGAIMTTATALIADFYQGATRNQVMGLQASAMGYGGVMFLILGGWLTDFGWRLPFMIYLTAFAVAPLILIAINEPDRNSDRTSASQSELTRELPTLTVALIYGLTFVSMLAFYMIPVQLPFYLQHLNMGGGIQSGLAIAAATLSSAVISLRYRALKSRLSFRGILVCLYSAMGLGYIIISQATAYPVVLIGLVIAGLGLGLLMPNMNVWLNEIAPLKLRGRLLGGLTTAMFLGQFCSPIVSQPLAKNLGQGPTYGIAGGILWAIAALLMGISTLSKPQPPSL
jgi:MFS family permease